MNYPNNVDGRIGQAVAIVVFFICYTILIIPDLYWLMYVLTIDFILRYIHPNLSPIARPFLFISRSLKLTARPYFAPPKRFAVLIGVFLSSALSISLLVGNVLLQNVLLSFLLIASFLQGFLDYCIGCELHHLLLKLGVIDDHQTSSSSF